MGMAEVDINWVRSRVGSCIVKGEMIDEQELRRLMAELESDRVERTTSTKKTDKFARAVCAFANDLPGHGLPGYLLLGVRDDGMPDGLQVTDELLRELGALRDNGRIQPLPTLTVSKLSLSDGSGDVAIVEVRPSDLPPVRYDGRIHIRVGPRRGYASKQDERILTERRTALARTFDARACMGSSLDDLVTELFVSYRANAVAPEVIEENQRSLATQLASLRFFERSKGCPTYAGILLFGKDPRAWLPGSYVQFVRFDGTRMSDDVMAEKEFSGDLLTILRELDVFVKANVVERPAMVSSLRERKMMDFPVVAIREFLMNAIMHRSYESTAPIRFYWFSDRIEIQNPGGLYGEATVENFPMQNSYRNPIIAEAMKTLGYVNKFGRGVYSAQRALQDNGNPEAQFKFEAFYVLVTVPSKP